MRRVICALAALVFASPAFAADLDLDILRGSQPVGPATFTRWSGFYLGGQIGYGDANTDFSNATQPLVAFSLRELALESDDFVSTWPVLGRGGNDAVGYGGFVGYNTQWQDFVLGLEGNYTHTAFATTASVSPLVGAAGRIVTAGSNQYSVNLTGTGQLDDHRLRLAPSARGMGARQLLAVWFCRSGDRARKLQRHHGGVWPAEFSHACLFSVRPHAPTCIDYDYSNSAAQNGALLYGFSVGGGLDWALTQNIFLRGEFEYVQFAPIANIVASIISARVGAGLKF